MFLFMVKISKKKDELKTKVKILFIYKKWKKFYIGLNFPIRNI